MATVEHLQKTIEDSIVNQAVFISSDGKWCLLFMNSVTLKNSDVFLIRHLNIQKFDDVTLLDAVEHSDGNNRLVQLFFRPGPSQDSIQAAEGIEIVHRRSISGAPMLTCKSNGIVGTVTLTIEGVNAEVVANAPETHLFMGMNVGFAVRNGESVDATVEWLKYHVQFHGMNGALILNRSRPGQDKQFERELQRKSSSIVGLERLVLLDAEIPLGKENLPEEAHPFNVPGAPGKDRMKIPEADPWRAPLGDLLIYELARARFLNSARAVMNIDVCDLVARAGDGGNIFDRACEARTGCIQMEGTQCYPWRIRTNQPAGFGDHIYLQFDTQKTRRRWCVAPGKAPSKSVWRFVRIVGADPGADETTRFYRHMALRHPSISVSKIVPKSSLVECEELITQAEEIFAHNPIRMPSENLVHRSGDSMRTTIVTTMKNEGPFIIEWIAYHRVIGVSDFLVYTNDCTDGTDSMLKLLQEKGIVQHRENPFLKSGLKPQQAALMAAEKEPIVRQADWLICMDVDEFINIRVGEGRLEDLIKAVGDANMIALTWRLFGNGDIHKYEDQPLCEKFLRCAAELIRKPHQAWGFKTLYRNQGIFKKLGVHRPKGLKPQLWKHIRWVNGSGKPMPSDMFRNGWRSTESTYGYELVALNHYAVRSAESFLVKRDRGRVNHVDRDQGLAYWFRMNNNAEEDRSIQRMLPVMRMEMAKLMADPEIAAMHNYSVQKHREKISDLLATDNYAAFYSELTNIRLERLSRLHSHFGANVFLSGPHSVPDDIVNKDPEAEFTFTVEKGITEH